MLTEKDAEIIIRRGMKKRYQGEYPEALDLFDLVIQGLAESESEGAKMKIGEAMHQLGVTLQNMGKDYKAALSCLWSAFAYRMAIGDIVGKAHTIFQIAMCRQAQGAKKEDVLLDFQRAKPYIMAVIKENIFTAEIMGNMWQNLAYIYQQEGCNMTALATYEEALVYRHKAGDVRGEGLTLARMAEIEEDAQKAEEYLNKAYKIFDSIGDVNRLKQVRETREKIQKRKSE